MDSATQTLTFDVVVNERQQRSIWPVYRREQLPPGWTLAGFRGSKEACLQHIVAAADAATPPLRTDASQPPASKTVAAGSGDRRATALPFPQPAAPVRLIVFPHAGSGASYYHFLARALRGHPIEVHLVQYPGREMRLREAPCDRMDRMVETLHDELRPLLQEKPFALFGHSMGSLIAFELTRRLGDLGAMLPRHLFLSGRQAPHVPGQVLQVEQLDDDAFLEAVGHRYKALPAELLGHREILELILPSLRADFTLMQRYVYRPSAALDIPITLLNGRDDPWISPETLTAWQTHFRPPIRQHLFEGGHFYLSDAAERIGPLVLEALA
jgi:medium-chain acyl-[acyl-carrier-protein] hydrolase